MADYHFRIDNHHFAYQNIIASKKAFIRLRKEQDVADCNILLLGILNHQNNLEIDTNEIIKELEMHALKDKSGKVLIATYYNIAGQYFNSENSKKAIEYYNKIIPLVLKNKDTVRVGHIYTNIGSVHSSIIKNYDSALYYIKKAVPILLKNKDSLNLSYNYNNQGNQYKFLGKYHTAIAYYKKANAIPLKKHKAKTKKLYYKNIAEVYDSIQDYKNATLFLNKLIKLKDSINDTSQNTTIVGIKEKYDNEKLRADNLQKEVKIKHDRNLLNMVSLLLLFVAITSILVYYNIKRKQKIIQNEKFIEQQKVSNLLKEQELIAIDAMIEGQEKERQLIASDLHDDLGALMTTLQYNFENLYNHRESEESESLFKQTKTLIKEAYQKIRLIAQAKNSGVIAKQGLLKAIKNNVHKIAKLNNIQIEIKEYGLENRLQNTLEITIFRIVQELLTNIIKHAKATQVIIHIINHKESLNIMVEDNGVGFNIENIAKSEGMGIKSIEKRVEFLEGTITIESIIEKGTTIIIDIPI